MLICASDSRIFIRSAASLFIELIAITAAAHCILSLSSDSRLTLSGKTTASSDTASDITQASPFAWASISANGTPSKTDGNRKTSIADKYLRIFSCLPAKYTLSSSPFCTVFSFISLYRPSFGPTRHSITSFFSETICWKISSILS